MPTAVWFVQEEYTPAPRAHAILNGGAKEAMGGYRDRRVPTGTVQWRRGYRLHLRKYPAVSCCASDPLCRSYGVMKSFGFTARLVRA